jgi:hypothetical protein
MTTVKTTCVIFIENSPKLIQGSLRRLPGGSQVATGVGPLRIGPFSYSGLNRIHGAILLAAFAAGVILSVVSQVTQGLGFALVVGSLFDMALGRPKLGICQSPNDSESATNWSASSSCGW